MKRQGRAAAAAELAPTAPPCFSSRDQWVEFVSAAAVEQRAGHLPGPLVLVAGEPARFNPAFDICNECDDRHAARMSQAGKCRPRYLIDLFAAQAAAAEGCRRSRHQGNRMTYKQHPLSAAFPAMAEDDFAALVADIDANGQRDPVVLFEDMVIDGWHRTRACDQLGKPPAVVQLPDGIDPVAYVMSRNLHRRHLTASQRAIAVAACAKWLPVGGRAESAAVAPPPDSATVAPSAVPEPAGKSLKELADDAGVSRRTMAHAAKVVKQAAPEVAQAVKDGTLPVAQAAGIAALPKDEQPAAAAAPPAKPARKPKPAPDNAGALADLQAQLDAANEVLTELTQNLKMTVDDNNAMAAVFEADDKLALALEQNKKLRLEVAGLRERINGLMNEKNEATRMVKHWRGRAERAEKAGAAA